jgi:hypothetical protein
MSFPYTVNQGDNLSLIARKFKLRSWMEIYYHRDNTAFRLKRPNPNLIFAGDVVMIPGNPPGDPGLDGCLQECERQFQECLRHHSRLDCLRRRGQCKRDCRGRPT